MIVKDQKYMSFAKNIFSAYGDTSTTRYFYEKLKSLNDKDALQEIKTQKLNQPKFKKM